MHILRRSFFSAKGESKKSESRKSNRMRNSATAAAAKDESEIERTVSGAAFVASRAT